MIKELISLYGKNKINTLTKYPSILTLHQLGERNILKDELTTSIEGEQLFATEKIDGTNVRIICYGDEYLIGSRDFILHHCSDLYFDTNTEIVSSIKNLGIKIPSTKKFTVIYGELYGGKITKNSKWYGTDKIGFRVFDIAVYDDLSILEKTLPEISNWREKEREGGIIYGQKFLTREQIEKQFFYLNLVPTVNFELGNMTHKTILNNLEKYVPITKVALSENSLNKCEGVVLRNADRTKIVKIRFEDYQRTLRLKKEIKN